MRFFSWSMYCIDYDDQASFPEAVACCIARNSSETWSAVASESGMVREVWGRIWAFSFGSGLGCLHSGLRSASVFGLTLDPSEQGVDDFELIIWSCWLNLNKKHEHDYNFRTNYNNDICIVNN